MTQKVSPKLGRPRLFDKPLTLNQRVQRMRNALRKEGGATLSLLLDGEHNRQLERLARASGMSRKAMAEHLLKQVIHTENQTLLNNTD